MVLYTSSWETLFDWWRGENGILFDGENMPGLGKQDQARKALRFFTQEVIAEGVNKLIDEGWFRDYDEAAPADFIQFLVEIAEEERVNG